MTTTQTNAIVKNIPPPTKQIPPATASTNFPRPPRDILETQIALMRRGISPGSLDGVPGSQTRAALAAFQHQTGLASSGELDVPTRNPLSLETPPLRLTQSRATTLRRCSR